MPRLIAALIRHGDYHQLERTKAGLATERSTNMRQVKNGFRYESLQDTGSIRGILKSIADGINKGKIVFSDEDDRIVLLQKSPFGHIFRSFSLNSYGYSPQTTGKSDVTMPFGCKIAFPRYEHLNPTGS